MAERRMFAKTIVLSDAFLDMPLSARCLYFTLGMLADDDGFVNNTKSIIRQIGANNDDLKELASKKFIITFEDGVIVIKHWHIHNFVQKDRYKPTKYQEHLQTLYTDENNAYTQNKKKHKTIPDHPARNNGWGKARKEEFEKSGLPYSFSYKIRNAFIGETCPVCGVTMGVPVESGGIITKSSMPTVQHNIPISKGGKHELSNISVICRSCNTSLQAKVTGPLNNDLVVEKWSRLETQDRKGKRKEREDILPTYDPSNNPDFDEERFNELMKGRRC